MIVHQVFAIINEEKVKNIIVCDNYELANQLARMTFGNEAFAVDCLQYPCNIGDHYINGVFYYKDTETPIIRKPTAEEEIIVLRAEAARNQSQMDEVIEQIIPTMLDTLTGGAL